MAKKKVPKGSFNYNIMAISFEQLRTTMIHSVRLCPVPPVLLAFQPCFSLAFQLSTFVFKQAQADEPTVVHSGGTFELLQDFIPLFCQESRRHVRKGDAGARGGSGAGGAGEEDVPLLLLWHRPLQGLHLRPHPRQALPQHLHEGRVQECGQTPVLLFEYVTEIYSCIISD